MITKTLGTVLIIFVCILMLPVGIGILGGFFGIVAGVFGAVFGIIGAVIGGIFGAIGWLFDGLFNWHSPFGFFSCNAFLLVSIVVVLALAVRSKKSR